MTSTLRRCVATWTGCVRRARRCCCSPTAAAIRPDIALDFCERLGRHDYGGTWEFVSRYEDRWLAEASRIGWLRAIKTALYLHGLLPSDRVGGTWMEGTAEERDAVRRCLEDVFGPLEQASV